MGSSGCKESGVTRSSDPLGLETEDTHQMNGPGLPGAEKRLASAFLSPSLRVGRTFDVMAINKLLSNPEMQLSADIHTQGGVDVTGIIQDQRNVLILATVAGEPLGLCIFLWQEPGVYLAHAFFLPKRRAEYALQATKKALAIMFLKTDCMEVLTSAQEANSEADNLIRQCGFAYEFELWKPCLLEARTENVKHYALRFGEWVKTADGLVEAGKKFHAQVRVKKTEKGLDIPVYVSDPLHERYVGMAAQMILGDQPAKGVILYNRWARHAGYGPLEVVSVEPLILAAPDGIIRIDGDNFFVEG